jgi:protocatechuate 3,4-dioxygenase beta subunit
MARALAFFAFLAAAALNVVAQSDSPNTIRGTVVAEETGQPIRNARIRDDDNPDAAAAATDAEGRFVLGPSPARHHVSVAKSGFLNAAATAEDGVEIRLTRGAAITGRIFDDLGEPLPLMNVAAQRISRGSNGESTFERVAVGETNDLGEYRLFGLTPGDYVIATAPGRLETATSSVPLSPERIVFRTFYGPAETAERARRVTVGPGAEVTGIDIAFALAPIEAMRPGPPPPPAGPDATAAIRGRVLRADGLPLRRGRVQLSSGDDLFSPYATATDDEGRYHFANLRAGTYLLSASTLGNERVTYGQDHPFEPASPVTLKAGETADSIDMTLGRSAAIGGRILDEYGDPLESVVVYVERIVVARGRRQLAPVPAATISHTDDQGRYRVFGLPSGRYVVTASIPEPETRSRKADPMGYAHTYFPGTPVPAEAQPVDLAQGQQALAMDFILSRSRVFRIAGTARTADNRPLHGMIALAQSYRSGALATPSKSIRTAEDGGFEFDRLPPGEYTIQAASARSAVSTEGEFALQFVTIESSDILGLTVALSRGSTIEGHLTFDGGEPPDDPDFHITPVPADPDLASLVGNVPARADVHGDGTFEISGISGLRRLELTHSPAGWGLKTIRVNGIDAGDTPFVFGTPEQSLHDVEVVVTDKITQLDVTASAAKRTRIGALARVVVFSTDRERWYERSRFVAVAPISAEKPVQFQGLPPGDFYVAALDRPGNLEDPQPQNGPFFESLIASATRVTLAPGEHRSISVSVTGR